MSDGILLAGLTGTPSALLISEGRVGWLGDGPAPESLESARVVRCDGLRAAPGFIELQINGIDDSDFTTDPGSMWDVGPRLARHGITAFLPTIVTSPPGSVPQALAALASPRPTASGAVPLGLHVEGPFISPARRGAHDERHLRAPDADEIVGWARGGMRILTIAPELPGAIEAIERLTSAGAVASVGHTDADARTTQRAVDAGARYATHLFNAMPPLHHRSPGAVGALLADDRVTLGLIADGIHVDRLLLGLVARLAAGRVSLVSDQVSHHLGASALATESGSPRLPDGTLAGSIDPIDHGLRVFADACGSVDDALATVTQVPARLLGLDDGRGSLVAGGRADVVLLDDRLNVAATLVGGDVAYPGALAWR